MLVSRTAILPYSAAHMYAVVADIRRYPDFLNWCRAIEVQSESELEVIATMHISYGKLAFSFATENKMIVDREIQLNLIDGPFTKFNGLWTFEPLVSDSDFLADKTTKLEGCKVSLKMDFSFERGVASMMMAKVFEKIAATQLEAFQQRAARLYQTRSHDAGVGRA